MKDPLFRESYRLGVDDPKIKITSHNYWRVYVACWAAYQVRSLEGDFVECGVNRGILSRAIIHYVDFGNLEKKFHLLDTFCGLVEEQITPEEKKLGADWMPYEECYEEVKNRFAEFLNVELIRGAVPDTLPLVKAEKISYLSLDMNCAAPEIAAAEYFWGKLTPGSVIVLDDYGWKQDGGELRLVQKRAFDKFAAERGDKVLSLPTGQGLIFKP